MFICIRQRGPELAFFAKHAVYRTLLYGQRFSMRVETADRHSGHQGVEFDHTASECLHYMANACIQMGFEAFRGVVAREHGMGKVSDPTTHFSYAPNRPLHARFVFSAHGLASRD